MVEERQRGLTSLRQINWASGETSSIAFDDPTYVTWLAYNPTPRTSKLRYGYSSMTTPTTLFELDMDTGERRILKKSAVKGLNAEDYKSEHHWIKVSDGTEVGCRWSITANIISPFRTRCWSMATALTAAAWMPISASAV